jgi:L,D-transpeptidase YcbB
MFQYPLLEANSTLQRHRICITGYMIKIIVFSVLSITLFSCVSGGREESADGESKTEKNRNISKRDLSITPSNAYNNLFVDSTDMENFLTKNEVNDTIAQRMRSFYNARNYQYAWFAGDGLTEQARGFWNMHNYHTTYGNDSLLNDKSLKKNMDRLIAEEDLAVSITNNTVRNTEFKLTEHFILYVINNIEDGYVKRKEMERFIPAKKQDIMHLADSLLSKKHKDNKYYEDVNESYKSLKQQLGIYYEIGKAGGWNTITEKAKQLKKESSSPVVVALKKRLQLTGDMKSSDTSQVMNEEVATAIKLFQSRHGYSPTGILTDELIKEMNVPVEKRLQQILVNMGRMQWMIHEPRSRMIVVNIPEFILHVKEGKKKVFDMDVVVGKEGHNTMLFSGNLTQIVFSPYWNVPADIVKKEILPAVEKDPAYLEKQEMEIVGTEDSIPVIRQLPGEKNALGKVKFLFPNSFDIYFHDTPSKSLFKKDKRAYSHGCIRLSDPARLATYLLQENGQWNPAKIDKAMNSGKEKYVKLPTAVPVLITYYTAWVDDGGLLHFADDIYEHDKILAKKMFTATGGSVSKN